MLSSTTHDTFVLTGDYNLADTITWWHDPVSGDYGASDLKGSIPSQLIDMLAITDMKQLNVIRNGNGRYLDLIITNIESNAVSVERSGFPLVSEDDHHPALQVCIDLVQPKFLSEKRPAKVNFFKADYVRLNEELLKVNWLRELGNLDTDCAVDKFYSFLRPFIDKIPKTVCMSRDYPVYYSYQLISMIKKKDSLRRKIRNEECEVTKSKLRSEFAELRKSVKIGIKGCLDDYITDCEEKIKSNTKCFFAFTKSLRKTNALPSSMFYRGEEATDVKSVCNLFASYFSSVYNPIVDPVVEVIYDPFVCQANPQADFTNLSFTPAQVEEALKGFNKNKVSSLDDIPMLFLALFLTSR